MTVISPLRPVLRLPYPGGSWWIRLMFAFTRIPDRRRAQPTGRGLSLSQTLRRRLRQLGAIHASHFALIDRFPDHGQVPEDVRQHLVMFESNYDGGFDQYIDAFSAIVPGWMKAFWGTSYGFPGPEPVSPFKDYIHANEFQIDHYYCAHPQATTRMIESALRFQRRHAPFHEHARTLSPEEFDRTYRSLLSESQAEL
jgi:hypothetical protein